MFFEHNMLFVGSRAYRVGDQDTAIIDAEVCHGKILVLKPEGLFAFDPMSHGVEKLVGFGFDVNTAECHLVCGKRKALIVAGRFRLVWDGETNMLTTEDAESPPQSTIQLQDLWK